MAGFNEIQVGRINRFVQKFLAIKGGPPVPSVSSDLQLVFQLLGGFELRYLQSLDTFFTVVSVTGAAGQTSVVQLRNPAASNVIAILERASASTATAADPVTLTQHRAPGAVDQINTNQIARNMDARGRPGATLISSNNNGQNATAIPGGATYYLSPSGAVANTNVVFEMLRSGDEIVIAPGDAVSMGNTALAALVKYQWVWRERFLEDAERT